MGGEGERDPDRLHDEIRDDDMPPRLVSRGLGSAPSLRPHRTEEEADREVMALRRRAERLVDVLCAIARDEPPPTIPDADEAALVALAATLEERIARAAVRRGHRYARRGAGPLSCAACARPIDRAAEACAAERR